MDVLKNQGIGSFLVFLMMSLFLLSVVGASSGYQSINVVVPPAVAIDSPAPPTIPSPEIIYPFLRGDANIDGKVDLSDLMTISGFLSAGKILACEDAGDVNDDGFIDLGDVYYLWSWLFLGGSAPLYPYPEIDHDPTTLDDLGCGYYLQ